MIDLISIQIIIISYKFLNRIVKFIKMFYLKLLKTKLNIIAKTMVFGIYKYKFIKTIYYIFI